MDGASVNISIKSAADLKAVRDAGAAAADMASKAKDANAAIRQSAGGIGELNKAVSILTKGMGGLGDIARGVFTGGLWSIGASLIKGAFDLIKGKIDENREQLENYRRSVVQSLDGMAKAANSYRIAVSGVAAAQRAAADAGLERATKELDLTERLTKATIELARQKRIAAGEDVAKVNAESDQATSEATDAAARGKADAEIEAIRKRGITVLLIEHDMRLVMKICHKLVVLEHGTLIAEGVPDVVRRDPAVIEAYLGSDDNDEVY